MVVSFLIKGVNHHLSYLPQRSLWGSGEMGYVLWKPDTAVKTCSIKLRRKSRLLTHMAPLGLFLLPPSPPSPPFSLPAQTTPAWPPSCLFLNLPNWLLPWDPYTCCSPIISKVCSIPSNLFSVPMSPFQGGHPWLPLSKHHQPYTFPETHSIPLPCFITLISTLYYSFV